MDSSHQLPIISPHNEPAGDAANAAIDPVCGMHVDKDDAKHKLTHAGTTHYFCCKSCQTKFAADPARYLNAQHQPQRAQAHVYSVHTRAGGTIYTCPMHPEVQQSGPGSCPKCGMALEPESPSSVSERVEYTCPMHPEIVRDAPGSCPKCGMALEPRTVAAVEENPELIDMTRRLWVSAALSAPLLVIAMTSMLPAMHEWLSGRVLALVEFGLATPVVLWGGWPFFVRMWQSIVNRYPNMFTLIGIGTGTAYLYSVVATLFPSVFPASFRSEHGGVELYFESAAVIVTLVLLGQVMELRARSRTGAAIRALRARAENGSANQRRQKRNRCATRSGHPRRNASRPARRESAGRWHRGRRQQLRRRVDDFRRAGAGGEKQADRLIGGTVNGNGSLVMRAERVGNETVLAQIVQMVAAAQRSRAPIQRLADKVATYFVPAVVLAAIVTFIVWAVFGPEPRFAYALINSVAVLIIACPCALGLATPMSIMVGVGRGASAGVLVKDAEALETMERVNSIVVDKTGTLTEGKPRLVTVKPAAGWSERDLLRLVAAWSGPASIR